MELEAPKTELDLFFGTNDIKIERGLVGACRGCLVEENLRDMLQTHYHRGKAEVYSDMLAFCFSIQLTDTVMENSEEDYLMCEICIWKLREAALFKTQIETAQQTFKRILDEKSITATKNSEFLDFDHFDGSFDNSDTKNDMSIPSANENDEDDKPLKKKRSKTKDRSLKGKSRKKSNRMDRKMSKKKKHSRHKISIDDFDPDILIKNEPPTIRQKKSAKEELPYKLDKNDLQCKICLETFPVHKCLQMHMPIHYPNHICDHCGRAFATRIQLNHHRNTHKDPKFSCPHCPLKKFKASASLKAHMRKHNGECNQYRCPVCQERFKSYNLRRKHMVDLHGEEDRKYACKHCPKRFCLATNLAAHVRNVHLQERKHSCLMCGATFFLKRGLEMHALRHTGEKGYSCAVCFKRFGRKYTLTEHMKIHNGERKHVCSVCGKAFTQKATLKGHAAVHEKEAARQAKTEIAEEGGILASILTN